jgi:hypothetical protein
MGTKRKTPAVLDAMLPHVRYEALQVVAFAHFGNQWCELLRPDLGEFAKNSLLEAALMHFRCLIEFLGEQPSADQVMARDYLPTTWTWTVTDHLAEVGNIHGRVAHLGLVRKSVDAEGDFDWLPWLTAEAPKLLLVFRDFLAELRVSSPHRYQLMVALDGEASVDLIQMLEDAANGRRH